MMLFWPVYGNHLGDECSLVFDAPTATVGLPVNDMTVTLRLGLLQHVMENRRETIAVHKVTNAWWFL
jgi:hypothetical protein